MKPHPICIAALAALAACSSLPERNLALEQVRTRHAAVRADDSVTTHAGEELRRADAALRIAEAAQAADAGRPEVDHLAYLTQQRLNIAQETATARTAQAVTSGATTERDRLRSSMSTAADRVHLATSDARVDSLEKQLQAMNARRTERGTVVTLGDLLFDTGKSALQADGGRGVQLLAEFMRRHPQRQASIEGHTDDVGSESSNVGLSDRRARSVMAALVGMGIGADRLRTRGFGEANPVGENGSAAGRQMNRRVEVIFATEAGDLPAR
jgi:outer membrane protein OmpA-like peptidoglycan-associated protein